MKAVFILFVVVLVAQTLAVPHLVKRNVAADGKDNFKAMMADVKVRVQDNVNAIPDSLSKYKNEFVEILREFDEPNNKIVCSAKMVAILDKLHAAINKIKSEGSEDAKRVLEIARANKNEKFNTIYEEGLEYSRHPELFEEEYC
ncbi:uncharacterized protein [Musca autumnalis]|uniref:uncharacterized protein n=1 Tax=Musca autumnalis TaxID=221902 RepID=UPI003CF5B4AA